MELFIQRPLEKSYDLSFYFAHNKAENNNVENELCIVPYFLNTPNILTNASTVPFSDAHSAVKLVLRHHDSLYTAAGLPANWLTIIPGFQSENLRSPEIDSNHLMEMDCQLFDAKIIAKRRRAKLRSFATQDFSRSLRVKVDRRNPTGQLSNEVDFFLKHGSVLFQSVKLSDEVAALTKMKAFLMNYGNVLNFDLVDWHERVYFVLAYDHSSPTRMAVQSEVIAGGDDYQVFTETQKGRFYRLEAIRSAAGRPQRFIISIPLNFQDRALLEFLRIRLPLTNITLPSYDLENI